MNMNLINNLTEKLNDNPKCFFYNANIKTTFAQLNKYSNSLADHLSKKVDEDGLVIIASPNSLQFIITYLAALKSERTVLLLPSLKFMDLYTDYLQFFKNILIVANTIDAPADELFPDTIARIPNCELLNMDSTEFTSNVHKNRKQKKSSKGKNDTIVLLATGGTTGIPKLVELTNTNLLSNLLQIEDVVNGRYLGQNGLTILPFFHAFGLLAGIHFPIFFGKNVYIKGQFQIKDFLDTITAAKIEICFFVPQIVRIINKALLTEKLKLPLQFCVSGADRLEREEFETFKNNTGISIIEGYGLTETSPVTHLNPLDAPKPESIGKPLPNTFCKIINGQLLIKGPQVMKGYFKNTDETQNIFSYEYLKTGDIAETDSDGYYYIKGRMKEVIKYAGESIFPYEIEKTIAEIEDVQEVAVIGQDHKKYGQVPVAFIVKKTGASINEKHITDYVGRKLPQNHIPRKITFSDSLPKTILGKVKKFMLQQYLQ